VDERLLMTLHKAINKYPERFTVKVGEEILFIPVRDVYWFDAKDKYVFLHTYSQEYIYDDTLKNLEERLDASQFPRIHKSTLINTDKMIKVKKSFTRRYRIQMADKDRTLLDIGKTYLTDIKRKLNF
jgi:two-component system LytT family response regulator